MSPFRLACLLSLAAFAAAPSAATTFRHLDLAGLAQGSATIVIGTVESTRTYWNPGRTRLFTDVTVQVTRELKGDESERLTLTQLGGELDGIKVEVPGAPLFREREEAVLFVWRDERGRAQVNGLGQGKFDIVDDPVSGEKIVQRRTPGLAIRDARSLRVAEPGEPPARLTLADFVSEIQRVVPAPEETER